MSMKSVKGATRSTRSIYEKHLTRKRKVHEEVNKTFKSMFGIAVGNRAFGYIVFVYELLSKAFILKSCYTFGNYMSEVLFEKLLMFGNKN
jgi:hypothetical protein